ncbi:hypothetical protein [Aphanothece stagnina]|uniref:hypothetical protein n=1 Tax=Aphanothece stagnina TaxID=1004305 RepID=UPI00398F7DC8
MISLLSLSRPVQHHWWLAAGGSPHQLADLLGTPLRRTGAPATSLRELLLVFAPLPALEAATANPASRQARFRYLICFHRAGPRLSCWRRRPDGIGWQRRCGPMPLAGFVARFRAAPA